MDRVIYVAMSGAKQMLGQQNTVANNLANASTTGYRAQLSAFRAAEVFGLDRDPVAGVERAVGFIEQACRKHDIQEPMRMSVAVTILQAHCTETRESRVCVCVCVRKIAKSKGKQFLTPPRRQCSRISMPCNPESQQTPTSQNLSESAL